MASRVADTGRGPADIAGLEPLKTIRSRWPAIIGGVLTLAMIAGLARELFGQGLAGLSRSLPHDPRFYLCFAALYMSLPTGDYIIFRRLWGIPIGGLVALIKKRIANEVVFGYSGEAYFYSWARSRARMVAAPFGAVKDVSILSAIAGNAITLAMIAVALPLGRSLLNPDQFRIVLGSAAITLGMSLPFLLFSRRVFSLPRTSLWWVFGVHCVRLVVGSVLIALAWHFALPGVSVGMWLFLAAGRLLVSRLPLVPNKDLLFANFAILLIGQDRTLSELIAFTAALTLLVHVVLIALFSLHALATRKSA
ncbi:hypothetical protein U1701_04850 [Sphingomonas sp. PB2P19]|uniref:hypothetical protein n=1 Tax=Sphingomonas rhamnosi TaxID=3096156 RepID=UPI002FCC4B03